MIRLSFDDLPLERTLRRLTRVTSDLAPIMDEIGADQVAAAQLRFETAIDPEGDPWAALAPRTVKRRRQKNPRPLLDRGHLRSSLTHRPGRRSVDMGSNLIYARIQQMGGRTGRGGATTIPARPYFGVSERDRLSIVGIVEGHLRRAAL